MIEWDALRIHGLLSFYVAFLKIDIFKSRRTKLIQLKCVKIDKWNYGIYITYVLPFVLGV